MKMFHNQDSNRRRGGDGGLKPLQEFTLAELRGGAWAGFRSVYIDGAIVQMSVCHPESWEELKCNRTSVCLEVNNQEGKSVVTVVARSLQGCNFHIFNVYGWVSVFNLPTVFRKGLGIWCFNSLTSKTF